MKFVMSAALVASASAATEMTFDVSFLDIAATVNSADAGWVAGDTDRFDSMDDVKMLCGTFQSDHPDYFRLPEVEDVLGDDYVLLDEASIPTDFDSRTQWDKCTVIAKIRDQSACGSCWAFGSTEAFEDRQCVATGKDTEFSTEDTAACCSGFLCGMSMGCNGGQPSSALDWMTRSGVVTGGDYTDIGCGTTCKPYTLKPCAHHVPPSAKYPACPSDEYPTPSCKKECSESGYQTDYTDDKHKAAKAYSIDGVQKIMSDIVQYGPVSAAFTVYSDFPTYKSGVYKHTTGSALGGHAVEIIGFGVENGEDYWLVKNSWNEEWGDNGTFKIARGNNECGIEDDISSVQFS
jgi:cathepsin B